MLRFVALFASPWFAGLGLAAPQFPTTTRTPAGCPYDGVSCEQVAAAQILGLLGAPFRPEEGLRRGFRSAIAPRTYERHPAQFASYLITSGLMPGPTGRDDDAGALGRVWDWERFECHDLRDTSWFIPAYCAVGDFRPFYTKFGEQLGPDELVNALIEQSADREDAMACGGMHLLHALLEAERALVRVLSQPVAQRLHDEVTRRRQLIERAVSDVGVLDPSALLNGGADKEEQLVVAGHLIELASLRYESPLLSRDKLHRLVHRTLADCLTLPCWDEPASLLTRDGPFDYAAGAHLVRGLGLYRDACASR